MFENCRLYVFDVYVRPTYETIFLVRFFGADFWYVCHGHKL